MVVLCHFIVYFCRAVYRTNQGDDITNKNLGLLCKEMDFNLFDAVKEGMAYEHYKPGKYRQVSGLSE